jgi:ATP-dependent Clp protease ATP-binding subunit ClpA
MTRSVIELAGAAAQVQRPREALTAIAELRTRLEELEELHVEDAIRQGLTWGVVASALGITRQAAHKKYARRLASPRPVGNRILITAEARRCVFHARHEAAGLGEREVGTGHLLLGVLLEEGTPAAEVLHSLAVAPADLRAVLRAARTARKRKAAIPAERLAVSEPARRVFEQAMREAVRRDSPRLAAEHLLFALVRDHGIAVKALQTLNVPADAVTDRLEEALDARRVEALQSSGRNVRLRA